MLKKVTFKNCKQTNKSMSRASKAQKSTYSDPKTGHANNIPTMTLPYKHKISNIMYLKTR